MGSILYFIPIHYAWIPNKEPGAELPGVDKDDIDISVTQDRVTIRGEKSEEDEEKAKNYYRVERSYGSFPGHDVPVNDREETASSIESINAAMITHAREISREINATAVLAYVDVIKSEKNLKALTTESRCILAARNDRAIT